MGVVIAHTGLRGFYNFSSLDIKIRTFCMWLFLLLHHMEAFFLFAYIYLIHKRIVGGWFSVYLHC